MNLVDISEIQKLVPMPGSIRQLSQMAFSPEAQVGDVVRVIECDQVLTMDVLKWANSAWSASQTPIATVREAVVRFGIENIFKLALGKRVAGSMKKACAGYELAENELWRHSIAAALTAECLKDFSTQPVPDAAFCGALIHDVGKLLLGKHWTPEKLGELRRMMDEEQLAYIEAEQRLLGTNHAEVGGAIARFWHFPKELVFAIEHHHDYAYPPNLLLDSVQIANAITKLLGIGLGSEQMNITIHSDVPRRMGLDDTKVEMLCVAVTEKLADTEAKWEL